MFLSDYLLKFLTTGVEVQGQYPFDLRSIDTLISGLKPHLKDIILNYNKDAKNENFDKIIHLRYFATQ